MELIAAAMAVTPVDVGILAGCVVVLLMLLRWVEGPDTPSFARRAPSAGSAQLRQDTNGSFLHDRGFLFRRRHWFTGTGCPPVQIGQKDYQRLKATQEQRPAQVAKANGRTWWWLEGTFYWDSAGYSDQDVLALVKDRERKAERRLARAHTLLNVDQAPTPQRRQVPPEEVRRIVFERDGGQCSKCGSRFDIQYDHIIPVALGGATSVENLQILCGRCNREKGADL